MILQPNSETESARSLDGWRALAGSFLAIGAIARVAPLFDQNGRLLQQFPTEDGYLMLTVARNLGIGNGMSIADGTIATNGIQPLATFLYALGFVFLDGDKVAGVAIAQLLQIAIGLAATFVLWRLAFRVFEGHAHANGMAALAAAAWWASPVMTRHTMNGLETGLYQLTALLVALALVELERREGPWRAASCLGFGSLLGLAFWTRIDAAFLILGVCLAHLFVGVQAPSRLQRLRESVYFGATSMVIGLPWLGFNLLRFGHILPVSGRSESFSFQVGENLHRVPSALFEYVSVLAAIPGRLESSPLVNGAALAGLVAVAFCLPRAWRVSAPPVRTLMVTMAVFATGLVTYYGAFFGAGFFISRYLSPLSPFLCLLSVAIAVAVFDQLRGGMPRPVAQLMPIAALVLTLGLQVRTYANGVPHMHFQVVRWVEANVPEDTWIGAIQTGTLGFFHDRTVNLDGKVNPDAMAARALGRIPEYVVERELQYLADWQGITGWMQYPPIVENFTVVRDDAEINLGVLRRDGAPRLDCCP